MTTTTATKLNAYFKMVFAAGGIAFSIFSFIFSYHICEKIGERGVLVLVTFVYGNMARLFLKSLIAHLGEAGIIQSNAPILSTFKTQRWFDANVLMVIGALVLASLGWDNFHGRDQSQHTAKTPVGDSHQD